MRLMCELGAAIGSALTVARSKGRTDCVAILLATAAPREKVELAAKAVAADAMMAQLLEEEIEVSKDKARKASKKNSAQPQHRVGASGAGCSAEAASSVAKGVSATAAAAAGGVVDAHMASKAAVADEALRLSVAGGEYEALARSLEEHSQHASEAVLAEARAARNRLKERRKKESIRLRKQHAGAMGALQQLHGLSTMAAVDELRERLQSAEHHAGTLTALDEELEVVRARLQGLTPVESVASGPVELTLDQLLAGTDGFASSKLVGSGGFGKVFEGTLLLPSLPAGAVPLELHHLPVAVKKARSGYSASELQGLHREVAILRECNHPHLLPLFGCGCCNPNPCLP